MELKLILAYICIIIALGCIHFEQIQKLLVKNKIKQDKIPSPKSDSKSVMGESKYVHKPIKEVTEAKIVTTKMEDVDKESSESKKDAVIPAERLNDVFSETNELDADFESECDEEENIDIDAEEEAFENGEYDKAHLAQGQTFEEIGNCLYTVKNIRATKKEEMEAGRILFSIEDTQLFNQINSAETTNKLRIANLMVLHIENHNKGIA